jgi:hypothetical protein
MLGAVVSVDPMTATLPVAPGRVHSGAPPLVGAAVGQVLAAAGVSLAEGAVNTSLAEAVGDADDVVVDDVSLPEPHAATNTTNDAAQAASTTEEDRRGRFTPVTLQPTVTGR